MPFLLCLGTFSYSFLDNFCFFSILCLAKSHICPVTLMSMFSCLLSLHLKLFPEPHLYKTLFLTQYYRIIESQEHRVINAGKDL